MSEPDTRSTAIGLTLCATAALLWAISATTARTIIDDGASPLELSEARAVVAAVVFWLVSKRLNEPRREAGGRGAAVALGVALAGVNLSYFLAIERLPVAIAVIIQYTAPALVVAYEMLFHRRRPTAQVMTALAGVLIGVALVSDTIGALGAEGSLDAFGLVMASVSAFGFAAYNLLAARAERSFGSVRAHAMGFTVATGVWLMVQIPRGTPDTLLEARFLPGIAVVTLVGTVAAFGVYSLGIRRVGASKATIASTLEPVAVAALAAIFLGQALTVAQIIGSVIVIASVIALKPRQVVVSPPGPAVHEEVRP